jgi:hypothetical protein
MGTPFLIIQEPKRRIPDNQVATVQRKVTAVPHDRRPAGSRVVSDLRGQAVPLGQVLRPLVQGSHALQDTFDSAAPQLGQCDRCR